MSACPCCGRPLIGPGVVLDDARRTVQHGETAVRLSPTLWRICRVLWSARHADLLPADAIIERVWCGLDEPQDARRCLHVHAARLKQAIAPLGLRIIGNLGRGNGY